MDNFTITESIVPVEDQNDKEYVETELYNIFEKYYNP